MDIQLMREFIALVNLKSYRKVAQQFHIAPSTLSRHIKAIGKELGHPLFENLRAYQLTDEGQVVFERFGILVGEYDGLLQALAAQGPHYVRIAYCFEDRAISHYVRAAKEKFERAHRRTRVKIISPQDKTISACLESGEADLSVMYAPPAANARRFKTQLLIPEPLLAAVPKGTLEHVLSSRGVGQHRRNVFLRRARSRLVFHAIKLFAPKSPFVRACLRNKRSV